jgi:type IV pilus assembly protein PilY1
MKLQPSRPGAAGWATAAALCAAGLLAAGTAGAQKIDDVPPAVQNNVAPNFMFMIDNSGSMSNIVPAAPYDPAATYLASCSGSSVVPAGTSVDIRVRSGAPRFHYNGTTFRHTTVSGSEPARCFNNTAIYGARLLADSGSSSTRTPGSYLDSEYSGHYLNWYFGNYGGVVTGWSDRKLVTSGAVESRIEIARESAKTVVDALPLPTGTRPAVRVGLSTYRPDSTGGALRVAMGDFTSTTRTTLKNSINDLDPEASTPLASTFADIGRYMGTGYSGNVATANESSVNIDTLLRLNGTDNDSRNACLSGAPSCTSNSSPRPIQYWCQRTSLFAMTDGRPQSDRAFNNNSRVRDYDGDCSGSNRSTCVSNGAAGAWDRKIGRTYESAGSDYMDDVAKLLFDVDLRPDLTKPDPAPGSPRARNNITTYMIGFADPAVQNDPLLINTARQGGGKFIAATDGPALVDAFRSVIADALAKDAAAAAVAVTNAQIAAGSVGYASSYNSGSWYGDLEAYSLDIATGLQNGPTQWSFRDRLNAQSPSTRRIVSWNGSSGVPFTTANGAAFRTTTPTLTDGVINYIRGDRTGEGTTYRARTYLLGDIINAEPVVVNYTGVPVVYQAANDGLLHVIDGRVDASVATRGQELWAYVPRIVHPKLPGRADPIFQHEYLVDSTPATAEVTGVGAVGRILAGGLGKGGAGYYALDITTPTAASEAAAAGKVLWESRLANMGYSFGTPLIVNTAQGWRVVVASGLRNDTAAGGTGGDGRGHVWVLNPATGAVEKEFITPAGFGDASASLGLAHLARPAGGSASAVVRYVYGGDLLGNVWRFDLNAPTLSNPVRLAAVTAANGSAQPITVPPVVSPVSGSATRMWIYFGTGQYFSMDDVPGTGSPNATASQTQTIYGLVDDTAATSPALPDIRGTNGSSCPSGGGNGELVCQSVTGSGGSYTVSHNPVDPSSRRGFYLDIPLSGGRVNTQAALTAGGTLVVVVNQPSDAICNPGGTSTLFQLSGATGGAIPKSHGGTLYFDSVFPIADALSSRPVLVTTSSGTRAIVRLSDKTTQSRQIDETAGMAPAFRRVYMRALN